MIDINQEKIEQLKFNNDYDSFVEFLEDTRFEIYNSVFKMFSKLYTEKLEVVKMVVIGKINGKDFDTDFIYTKKQSSVITDELLPFYEKREDYEMCQNIKTLYKNLN